MRSKFDDEIIIIEEENVVKFKKKKFNPETNVGVIVFTAIFIYLLCVCLRYVTTHNISTYEVSYGSIINDTAYTGLVLREETIYYTNESGYVQFYHTEGSRLSYDNIVYTVSETSIDTDDSSSYSLSSSEQSEIQEHIQAFNSSYDNVSFESSYDLIEDITFLLNSSENDERLNELSELDTSDSDVSIYRTEEIGILGYVLDGYESTTIDNFTASSLDKTSYTSSKTTTGSYVASNVALYKLITEEEWYIIIEVQESDLEAYETLTSVEVKFLSDGESINADISLLTKNGVTYGILSLDSGMIRYVNERFISIELILEDLEGYKIPISSVIAQEFYQIPIDYLTQGGTSGSSGVLIKDDDSVTFAEINTYYKDTEYAYVLASEFGYDQTIIQEETSDTLLLSERVEMDGVYVVNKGYAEYKLVTILTSSSEYYIVDDSMSYSITNYDHIALYGDSVSENAIIN